jgi:D-3-phosphoglycerate dehydrogenase
MLSEVDMFKVWCERPLPSQYAFLLDGVATAVGPGSTTDNQQSLDGLSDAHAVIASSKLLYDGALMDRAPKLRVISRTGIGVDRISIPDATARGIAVCNTPDGPTVSTAEFAITLLLAVTKDVPAVLRAFGTDPGGDHFASYQGLEVHGLLLGVIGVGRIGSSVARMALALGMRVVGYDPVLSPERAAALGIAHAATLEDLLERADIVSLHLPLTAETRHLMNAERLARLKRGAILINTARGGLIDEAALLAVVSSGHLYGVGLDVLEHEPARPDDPLLHCPRITVTPHIAAATGASKERLWRVAIAQALQVLRGERPPHLVNPEVWPVQL